LYDNENGEWKSDENAADYIYVGDAAPDGLENSHQLPLVGTSRLCKYHLVNLDQATPSKPPTELSFIEIDAIDITPELVERLKGLSDTALIIAARDYNDFYALRNAIFRIITAGLTIPIVASLKLRDTTSANLQIQTSAIAGPLFIDGLADGLMLTINQPADVSQVTQSSIRSTTFGILQASRVRITKTEFISCPGCGRTLFNLNQTLLKVKQRLAHLKGLKIGVMGCIVNGPGEMADADYGYVGSGPGRVTLYRKQEVVKKNIPEDKAVDELIELIKLNGDWVDG
jgi:(E)-4-hydroxy-3-methylbut-2-enyl-diphosphate synthase